MAKTPEIVDKFLSDLASKLQPLWRDEKAEMLKLKKEEVSPKCLLNLQSHVNNS